MTMTLFLYNTTIVTIQTNRPRMVTASKTSDTEDRGQRLQSVTLTAE